MNTIIRFLFFAALAILIVWAGYVIYQKLNRRIMNSTTGVQLLLNSLLLFLALAALLSAGIWGLIFLYEYFFTPPAADSSYQAV